MQVGWLLALKDWRTDTLCPLCGQPKEVCQAPYGEYVYGTTPPVICRITEALDTARKEWSKHPTPGALLHFPRVAPWGTPLDGEG